MGMQQEQVVDPDYVVDSVTRPSEPRSSDVEPIDITLDDEDHKKVFGQVPPPPAPVDTNAIMSDQYPALVEPLVEEAHRLQRNSCNLRLPGALHDSGLVFNRHSSLSRVEVSQAALDSEDATFSLPTPDQYAATKPHPEALFVAESLEWRVILDQTQLQIAVPPIPETLDASRVYEVCNLPFASVNMYDTVPVTVPVEVQRHPIQRLELWTLDTPLQPPPVATTYNVHTCWITGKKIFSTPPGLLCTVVDRRLLVSFKESRENSPAVGFTGPETFIRALRVLLRIIGNALHGEARPVPTSSATIVQKLGWDALSRSILHGLGWSEEKMPDGREALTSPVLFQETLASQRILKRLMRAWIELSVWLAFCVSELRKHNPASAVLEAKEQNLPTKVSVEAAAQEILDLIGWREDHDDTSFSTNLGVYTQEALHALGASPQTIDELVKFAYLYNVEASPNRAIEFFSCLEQVIIGQRASSKVLEMLLTDERNRGKYSVSDVDKAYQRLSLTPADLGDDVPRDSIPFDFIIDNYQAKAKRALVNAEVAEYAAVRDALRLVTISRGSPNQLVQALDQDVDMDIKQAYKLLEVNAEMDDATVLVVYDLYIADAPARKDLFRHALRAIAEDRNSTFLRHFLKTGEKDPSGVEGWQQEPSADRPAGINNIGNTCYLNSVLQYFFSIREIRDRVLMASATLTSTDANIAPDPSGELSRRVGGRYISPRELQRSRKFVAQLAQLFHHLIHTSDLAVTPERELAYLALVSSRAEELQGGFDPVPEAVAEGSALLTEEPAEEVAPSSTSDPQSQPLSGTTQETQFSEAVSPTNSGEIVSSASAPPLPPRPQHGNSMAYESSLAPEAHPTRRNSLMQLGAQQDVSECLDNCMFQLEVALAMQGAVQRDVGITMDVDGDTPSEDLLSGLFLGKTCQRIHAEFKAGDASIGDRPSLDKQDSMHVKNEVFKILPIDVLEEGRDVYDGLDGFFDSETFVSTSGVVQRRSVTLLSPPPLLQIQMQRVQYDRRTMRAFKSQAYLQMDETIYVDRYVDLDPTNDQDSVRLAKRKQYHEKRARIGELRGRMAACKDGLGRQMTHVLSQAADLVDELGRAPSLDDVAREIDAISSTDESRDAHVASNSQSPRSQAKQAATEDDDNDDGDATIVATESVLSPVTPSLLATLADSGLSGLLRSEAGALSDELKTAEEEIRNLKAEMSSIWADEQRFAYHLVAVFMHRGEANHGHYFLNLGRPGKDGTWFKYNDSAITKTGTDQVVRDSSGATPYLVTYVRADHLQMIDPICRDLEQQPYIPTSTRSPEETQPDQSRTTTNTSPTSAEGEESPIKRARTASADQSARQQ